MADVVWLVVGLGNPGSKYESTRHNVGFDIVDELARRWGAPTYSKKFKSLLTEHRSEAGRVFLMKPQTYMNLSGQAVGEAATFYKIPPENVLVTYDDLDLPSGNLRLRPSGSAGGHNGMKSIIEGLGSEGFPRVRVGIGRGPGGSVDHVLGKIPKREAELFSEAVKKAADAVEMILKQGITPAMNAFNTKKKDKEDSSEP